MLLERVKIVDDQILDSISEESNVLLSDVAKKLHGWTMRSVYKDEVPDDLNQIIKIGFIIIIGVLSISLDVVKLTPLIKKTDVLEAEAALNQAECLTYRAED